MREIDKLNKNITKCTKCPRLAEYIAKVAEKKVKRFQNDKYYGKPVPGFGDVNAKVLIVGLAPAAHGANRTGRMFTGDSSGDWLAKAMYESGFASKPTSQRVDDGLILYNAYITASVRCAPPKNKPTKIEKDNCICFLEKELKILKNIQVIICLGKIAHDTVCKMLKVKPELFGHNKMFTYLEYVIITSYHPSKQNTQTGRLGWSEWCDIFKRVKELVK